MKKPQRSKYEQLISGEWGPLQKSWDLSCCDCHLVHGIAIRVRKGQAQIRFTVDNRATAAMRRHHKINVKRKRRGTAQTH